MAQQLFCQHRSLSESGRLASVLPAILSPSSSKPYRHPGSAHCPYAGAMFCGSKHNAVCAACAVPVADIMPDWGLVRDLSLDASISTWRAFPCPINTVGATAMTFGTASATVCRPITVYCGEGYEVGPYGDRCMNPAGFGAYAKAAVECSDGSWAARG